MPGTYQAPPGEKTGGDPNIMRVKEVNKIRPLDNVLAGWRQHAIEHPSDPEQFRSVVCPGPRSCPLCRKPVDSQGTPRFPISRRFGANVWDYDTGSVKVLIAGPQVFDELKAAASVGIDPSGCDWTITKTGTGRNTEYKVIRHDVQPFSARQITPDLLHDLSKYEEPLSTEAIFEVLDKFGIDYDSLEVPSYTYDQALAFVMPYGKHKGLSVEQLLSQELEYAEYIHGSKLEQGSLGDPVFLALQTALEERGLTAGLDDALASLPEPQAAPPPQAVSSAVQPAVAPDQVQLVSPDGELLEVPASAAESLLAAGFSHWTPPAQQTPVDANAPTKVLIGGKEVELPREQALTLIAAGTAQEYQEAAPEPTLPLPDETVQVDIKGVVVDMPYVQGALLVDNPTSGASFANPDVATAHARASLPPTGSEGSSASSSTDSGQVGGEVAVDPEKPFRCDQCSAAYKTQGALTQHKNREHKAAEPQPSAIPAASDGSGGLAEALKDKIARSPIARDYQKLLDIFAEETGSRNFAQIQGMDDATLQRLEARIDKEIAIATAG